MKLIHLSDLHLGKRISDYSMIEDQEYILKEIIKIVDTEKPDGIILAGDIYDKPVPSAEAVELFDSFLVRLAKRKLGKEKEACRCFNKLMDYGERHVRDVVENDYFAVSMPDFLIFETDLSKKNTAHCFYLMGLAEIGSGDAGRAKAYFDKALEYEYDHQNAILYKRMIEEELF